MWNSRWDPEIEKDINGKINEITINFGAQLIIIYQCWFLSFDKCTI